MIHKVREDIRGHERVAIRLPRGGGKTTASLEWALDNCQGQHIGYIRNHYPVPSDAIDILENMGRSVDVERYTRDELRLGDGTKITFLSPRDSARGIRFDALVFDEFGTMPFDLVVEHMAAVTYSADFPICLTYTEITRDMNSLLERMESIGPIHKVTYDYLDMVEHGLMRAENVRKYISIMGRKAFARDFGPYKLPNEETRNNNVFTTLLQRP